MIQFQFDDSIVAVKLADPYWGKKYEVRIAEGTHLLELLTDDGGDLVPNAWTNCRAVCGMPHWVKNRIVFCAELARRKILTGQVC